MISVLDNELNNEKKTHYENPILPANRKERKSFIWCKHCRIEIRVLENVTSRRSSCF